MSKGARRPSTYWPWMWFDEVSGGSEWGKEGKGDVRLSGRATRTFRVDLTS